ncbi:hypothetical protein F2Q69_00063290 [Brassica cretica]|uniref:Ubiquitin-like domain-containing protein n=1 Tax=Brassica cretica TaxID=69181 RepID=A0A8S9RQJ6_BRACR|nr:hypothetical protein F2Q69_00063290 [Brassica cretica]
MGSGRSWKKRMEAEVERRNQLLEASRKSDGSEFCWLFVVWISSRKGKKIQSCVSLERAAVVERLAFVDNSHGEVSLVFYASTELLSGTKSTFVSWLLLVTGTQEKMYVSHANTLTWKMSSPSSPSSSSGFSFFLKVLPSGDVILIEASRRDRVSDIMARIKINKKIPGFEQCALVYGGRQLQSHQLLCDCSIEKNTLVFLIVGPNPWPAVDSLLDTVCRVYQGLGVDNDEISDKLNLFFHNIPCLLKKVRPQKNLYLACWNVFASMSDCVSTCGEGMKSFITRAVVSFSIEVAILLQNTTILENMTHAEVFAELLTSLGKVLEDESQLTSRHFSVIALSSGFYKFRKEELIGVLSTRRASLCSLVIRFAEKGTNHQWLNE